MSRTRLLITTTVASLLLAAGGFAWEVSRFGWTPDDHQSHLQRQITRRVAGRAREVETKAVMVSRHAELVASARESRERLSELFARVSAPVAAGLESVSATVWIPTGPIFGFRALAWTDGPAQEVSGTDLNAAAGLFVSSGPGGLRLVFARPIELGGARIGVATAEVPLSAPSLGGTQEERDVIASSAGPIRITPIGATGVPPEPGHFTVHSPAGVPLLHAFVPLNQIADARSVFRRRAAAVALLPWAACALVLLADLVGRRRSSRTSAGWARWTAIILTGVGGVAALAAWAMRLTAVPPVWLDALGALTAIAVSGLVFGDAWWRARPRPVGTPAPALFVFEHTSGGAALLGAFFGLAWLWHNRMGAASIEQWQLPVLPSTAATAAGLAALLFGQIAIAWAVAACLGLLAARWRLTWRRPVSWLAAGLWLVPSGVAAIVAGAMPAWPIGGAATIAATALAFGLSANAIRRHYRHTSEARRLVLQFFALVTPVLAAYPLAAWSADQATRRIIEDDYSLATQAAKQPDRLMRALTSAWADIDAIPDLPDLVREAGTGLSGSELAFRVWKQTILATERVTSQIELYGPTHALVSRFAPNVPGFGVTRASDQAMARPSCVWDAFPEVARFGAGERLTMHAERALCGAGGEFLGAVVIRIIPDYRTLPFVTSANPYYDALGGRAPAESGSRVSDLQVVVYGWSLQPVFVSGRVMWPLDEEVAGRLSRSRDSFWVDRPLDDRMFHLYFLNDRGGIYTLGYPAPTPLQHATRLAESAAALVVLFVLYLAVTTMAAPLVRRHRPALARLFVEVRTSFYRKLFLFFVVAAVGPVLLFAIAFGTYMTTKLRADVESEAGTVVLMARRVLDELSAAQTPVGQARPAPTDEMMVLIRQVVDQDVNVFEGSELRATSQRDLFGSGLLPTRTPASVYRQIALDRRPAVVMPDRIGSFQYLVAAAPIPALGPEAVLTVPLASRQREFERQIDELTRGVLTGAVVLVLFAAALGASVAARVSDPVARLTRATRLIAAGRFDERLAADTADELGRLVDDFNTMTEMLMAQRSELARANQLKAWAEMARQVAHDIKNPLTPIQLAAEHLQRVHDDAQRPLGPVVEHCLRTILGQVRLLRQIASEFSTFAGSPVPRIESVDVAALVEGVIEPYRAASPVGIRLVVTTAPDLPAASTDRTLVARALTNLVENAMQAMPSGGRLEVIATADEDTIEIRVIDTGVGMDAEDVRRAFEPYFSTKTAGSGLGLANARRNVETCGGTLTLTSEPGQGTIVTMRLPAVRPAAPGGAQ